MATAVKLSVTLTPEMVRDLDASVVAGEFASTSEALRDAVRIWRDQRQERAERLSAIKARVSAAADDARPRLTPAEVRTEMARFHREQLDLAAADAAA